MTPASASSRAEEQELPAASPDWAARLAGRMGRVKASEIRELLKLLDQPDVLSFAGGIPDPDLFPQGEIAAALQGQLADPALAGQALQYTVSEGLPALRRWIVERMARWAIECAEANVLVTAGSQQALDLIGKLLISPGDAVLVDRPTYLGALQAFNAYEPTYVAAPMSKPAPRRPSATSCPTSRTRLARALRSPSGRR